MENGMNKMEKIIGKSQKVLTNTLAKTYLIK